MSGQLSIQGQLTGLPTGSETIGPLTVSPNESSDYEEYSVQLTSNIFNVIPVPTWAAGVIIVPSTENSLPITLKGGIADTGVPISPSGPTLLEFPADPPSSIGLTVTGIGDTGIFTFVYF